MSTITRGKEYANAQDIESILAELIPVDNSITPSNGDILVFNSIKQEYEPSGFTPFAFPPGTDLNAANSSGWIDIQPTIDAITNIDSTHL